MVPKDKLEVKGPIKKWKGQGSSGNAVWRWFCEECGSPIAHDPDAAPEIIALKGGSLDSEIKKNLKPVSEYYSHLFSLYICLVWTVLVMWKKRKKEKRGVSVCEKTSCWKSLLLSRPRGRSEEKHDTQPGEEIKI